MSTLPNHKIVLTRDNDRRYVDIISRTGEESKYEITNETYDNINNESQLVFNTCTLQHNEMCAMVLDYIYEATDVATEIIDNDDCKKSRTYVTFNDGSVLIDDSINMAYLPKGKQL